MPWRIAPAAICLLMISCSSPSKEPQPQPQEQRESLNNSLFREMPMGEASRQRQREAQEQAIQAAQNSPTEAPLGSSFFVGYGRTISITGTPLKLKFEELVSDSRCPSGGQCFLAGDVTVKLTATSGDATIPVRNVKNDIHSYTVPLKVSRR
jgi:hypothetical protein